MYDLYMFGFCLIIGLVNRFQSNHRHTDWQAVNRILGYLRGMMDSMLYYQGGETICMGRMLIVVVTWITVSLLQDMLSY